MTLDQIVEETRQLTREQVAELADCLTLSHQAMEPGVETTWKTEAARRVAEIQSGQVQGIPGEEVSARIRKIGGL
jgi:putative addiction module component (TIGR02574 family)